MSFTKDLYRFLSFLPLLFLIGYVFIVATNGNCWGLHDLFVTAYFFGIVFTLVYPLPLWIICGAYTLFKEPRVKNNWIYFFIFLLPALILLLLFKLPLYTIFYSQD